MTDEDRMSPSGPAEAPSFDELGDLTLSFEPAPSPGSETGPAHVPAPEPAPGSEAAPEPEFTSESEPVYAAEPSPLDGEPALERVPRTGRRRSGRPSRGDARHASTHRRAAAPDAPRRAPRSAGRASGLPASPAARTRRLVVALGILVAIVAVLAYMGWSTLYRATAGVPAGRRVTVVVPKGASGEKVADLLANAGVVANPTMFRVQAQLMNATSTMKAGTYRLVTGSTYENVIRLLQAGPPAPLTVTITIPEGWGIERTAARVEEKFGIPASEFTDLAKTGAKQFHYAFLADNPTKSLEGYLFPKTYTLKVGAKAADLINAMLAQYGKETAGLDYGYAQSKGLNPHEALTIASIIEREASVPSDRPKVASVIYNRLAINMRLQLDSTAQYANNGKAKLTLSDLKNPSPYNTYMHNGVPPGPICSPGLTAIKAAIKPAKTNYLYYILTHKDGRQSFATNYADFLVLKAQFKAGLK